MLISARLGLLLLGLLACACGDTGPDEAPTGGGAGSGGSSAAGGAGGTNAPRGGMSGSTAGAGRGPQAGAGGATAGGGGRAGGGVSAGTAGETGGNSARAGNAGSSGRAGGTAGVGGTGGSDSGESGADPGGATGDAGSGGASNPGTLPGFELAVIGSSTAAGEGASSSARGWVRLLSDSLEDAIAGSFSADNLAVGGYTTTNLLPDSGSSGSVDDAIEREPNLIIVALAGSNDLSNGVSTATFLSRLNTIRDAAVNAGIPIFFVSTAPKDLSDEEKQTLADWADAMGDAFGSCWTPNDATYAPCFIDIFAALADSSLGIADEYGAGDGIHLNDAGHARIFELAEPIVRAYACSMTECD